MANWIEIFTQILDFINEVLIPFIMKLLGL